MKKIILAILLLSSLAFAVSVDRSMPSRVDPSSGFTVSFTVNPEGSLSSFDLVDFVPSGWNLNSWDISGYSKSDVTFDSKVLDYQGKTRNGLHWKFSKNLTSAATLSYTMTAPATTGSYEFIAVWTYPGGFNSKTTSLTVGQEAPPAPPQPAPVEQPAEQPTSQPEQPTPPQPAPAAPTNTWLYAAIFLIIVAAIYWFSKMSKKKPR